MGRFGLCSTLDWRRRMPLDPQAQALIASVAGGKPVEQMTPQEMRDALEERVRLTGGPPEPVDQVVPGVVPGPAGPIVVRIYTPKGGQAALPGLVYLHGGGWARGSLQTHDIVCRSLANGAGCVVVSVDYRMAPEHRFPAAFEDSLAATRWVAEHAAELGIDPRRLAVGGGRAYADRLREAGTPVLYREYPGMVHGFVTSAGVLDAGKQAVREAAAALKDAFRVPSSGFRVGVLS